MTHDNGPFRIGVDIGGTFSDFVILDEGTGGLTVLKVPSTPEDPSIAVLDGLRQLAKIGVAGPGVTFFSHGTTIATNALLEGKGATAGLLVTQGFRGIQEVQDQTRGAGPPIYDFFYERPPLLVRRERTGEVPERLDYRGDIVRALDIEATRQEICRLLASGADSFAVCLLFSFMNPIHERKVRELVQAEAPHVRVSLSSEVLPVIREWFRLSTTQVNAYVAPQLFAYLRQMERRLEELDIDTGQRYVMQSNGGVTSFGKAADDAVTTVLSGPAAGVIAGARLAEAAGFPNTITFDIGGTSTDIALVEGGTPVETTSGRVAGYDVAVPMLDINTISAGGGTIAWVDAVGTLRCGPQSAGAHPGPACYGKGGVNPTITDANLVLGYLNPLYFLGGKIPLDPALSERAIARNVAEPLGLPLHEGAAGVVRLINVQMAQGVRAVSSERGYDLRDFAIVAFGGAGPVHASAVAAELGVPWVIIPPYPGLTSAMGLLMSDVKHDYARSALRPVADVSPEAAGRVVAELDSQAMADLTAEGFSAEEVDMLHQLDLRYAGQGYELRVPLTPGPLTAETLAAARRGFDNLHEKLHGHRADDEQVELVTYWTIGLAHVPKIVVRPQPGFASAVKSARKGARRAWFLQTDWLDCPIYERDRLPPGIDLIGPAIVEQVDSTTVVHPGQRLTMDAYGNLLLQVTSASTPTETVHQAQEWGG